jgi:hypothetical protein
MFRVNSIVLALLGSVLIAPVPGHAGPDVTVNIGTPAPPVIALPAPPRVIVVPNSPVYYAPDVGANLFVYDKQYYTVQDGHWFRARSHRGPWAFVEIGSVPGPVRAVPVKYYKVPPGHAKSTATGIRARGMARAGGTTTSRIARSVLQHR